jgi:hypothetical protein
MGSGGIGPCILNLANKYNISRWVNQLHASVTSARGRNPMHTGQDAAWAADPVWPFSFFGCSGTESTITGTTTRPAPDDDKYGTTDGMIGRGNRSTRRKSASLLLCPPQILHDPTQAQTWAAAVGGLRLTAWAVARSSGGLPSGLRGEGNYFVPQLVIDLSFF